MKPKSNASNRGKGQPVKGQPVKGQGQPLTPPKINPEVKPLAIDPSQDYTLECIIKGYQKFDRVKWKYSKLALHLIRFDLKNDEGSKIDEHIPLSIGSTIDEIESLTVKYSKGESRAMVRAVKVLTPTIHWEVNGIDSKGQRLEGQTLMRKVKNEQGQEVEEYFTSKSASGTARFLTRDLLARVRNLTLVAERDTSELTLAKLIKSEAELTKKRLLTASKMATLDPSSNEFKSLLAILDPLSQELTSVQGQIAKIREGSKIPLTANVEDILNASLTRVTQGQPLTLTPDPEA